MPKIIPISVPSLYDGAILEGRLLVPNITSAQHVRAGAVLAHPYAPLGGCYDDPVVSLLAEQFQKQGLLVATFNFRGAGRSEGKTSWSSAPEQKDFVTFAGVLIYYVSRLLCLWQAEEEVNVPDTVRVVYGGYSYGAMIAGRTAPAAEIYEMLSSSTGGTIEAELIDRVKAMHLHSSLQEQSSIDSAAPLRFETLYLLTSPILPPISIFLALSMKNLNWKSNEQYRNLNRHRALVVTGGEDGFSSSRKMLAWAGTMRELSGSTFEFEMVTGAGHFWREDGVSDRLQHGVATWIKDVVLR